MARLVAYLFVMIFVIIGGFLVDADPIEPIAPQNLTQVPFTFDFTIHSRRSRSSFRYNGTLGKLDGANGLWELYTTFTENDQTLLHYANSKMASQKGSDISCVDPKNVLLDDILRDSFLQATPLRDDSTEDELVQACEGSKWSVRITNDVYIICSIGTEWKIFAEAWYGETSNFRTVAISAQEKAQLVATTQGCATARYIPVENSSPRVWQTESRKRAVSNQIAPNNTCIFIHGAGEDVETTTFSTTEIDYWDGISDYLPQCSKTYFLQTNTKRRGYYSVSLQREVCAALLVGEPDNLVRNKIVFAHSMGSLVIAAAIQNGFCNLDVSTAWYDAMAPMWGSPLAIKVISICQSTASNLLPIKDSYCAEYPGITVPHDAYTSLIRNKEMDNLTNILKSKISGLMCGNTYRGLASTDGMALSLLASTNWTDETNDGMVPWTSCIAALPNGTSIVADYNNKYYAGDINHADGTCRNGDGWFGSPKRNPCSWYAARKGTGIYTRRP